MKLFEPLESLIETMFKSDEVIKKAKTWVKNVRQGNSGQKRIKKDAE